MVLSTVLVFALPGTRHGRDFSYLLTQLGPRAPRVFWHVAINKHRDSLTFIKLGEGGFFFSTSTLKDDILFPSFRRFENDYRGKGWIFYLFSMEECFPPLCNIPEELIFPRRIKKLIGLIKNSLPNYEIGIVFSLNHTLTVNC